VDHARARKWRAVAIMLRSSAGDLSQVAEELRGIHEPVQFESGTGIGEEEMVETVIETGAQTVLLATFLRAGCALRAGCGRSAGSDPGGLRDPGTAWAGTRWAGVINLRGKIVTLLDFGMMLGFGKSAPDT